MNDEPGQSKQERPEEQTPKWGDPISPERQAELQGHVDRWAAGTGHGGRKGPFAGVKLTGVDVFWLAEQSERDADGNVPNLHLEDAALWQAHLEGVDLGRAHLERANLWEASLEGTNLRGAHLEGAYLREAHLERANLWEAHLEHADLGRTHLEGANLWEASLEGTNLYEAYLEGASLRGAHLEGADLSYAHLERARLYGAHLEGTNLYEAYLEGASLRGAHLEGKTFPAGDPDLLRIRQWKVDFPPALPPANLEGAFFDDVTKLNDITLFDANEKDKARAVTVADLRWRGANLAVAHLPPARLLGDERSARNSKDDNGKPKDRDTQIAEFQAAVRANRQLAVALKDQGLNEDADRFAYNAQLLQQQVLRRQRKFGAYFFSRLLDGLAGYGYKPARGLIAYVVVILGFAAAYGLATHGVLTFGLPRSSVQPLQWYEALVLSISSFHGRGFFQPVQSLGDPVAIIAAAEAILGLLIEISFIATFTQRFFGR